MIWAYHTLKVAIKSLNNVVDEFENAQLILRRNKVSCDISHTPSRVRIYLCVINAHDKVKGGVATIHYLEVLVLHKRALETRTHTVSLSSSL